MKLLLPLLLLLFFAFPVSAAEDTGEVHGLVFDKETGAPVPEVGVFLDGEEIARTSGDGAFHLELPAGTYDLTLRRVDYPDTPTGSLAVIAGEVTEVLVDLGEEEDEGEVEVESAAGAAAVDVVATEDAPLSAIEGRVVDAEKGAPVAGVRIFVRGFTVEGKTGPNGKFRIEIPVGTHDVSAVHPDYSTMTRAGVEVVEGEAARVELEAVPTSIELEEFTVTAPRVEGSTVDLLKERKDSSAVSDVIGAEQMSRAGDSDAAGALKRVTGVTIVGGKYVYVRGLGERYSSTLLNGLSLPSPEPERRVVPLDMFPTGILKSVVIQKTYSPDMPGEFGGGVVQLRTKTYPEQFTLELEASGGVNVGTTFARGEVPVDEGSTDWLGIDGGHRALPRRMREATEGGTIRQCDIMTTEDCFDMEELADLAGVMPNNWGTKQRLIPPDQKYSATVGAGTKLGPAKLGFMTSLLYKNDWDLSEETRTDYYIVDGETGEMGQQNDYVFNSTDNTVTLGGILTLGAEITEDHRIEANTIVDRITDDSLWRYEGFSRDSDADIKVLNLEWIERMLFSQQLIGTHVIDPLGGLTVDWRYAFSRATRHEPDKRRVRYDYTESEDLWILSGHTSGNARDYLDVRDDVHDMGLDFTYPFEQWTAEEAKVKAGGAVLLKERENNVRRFWYRGLDRVEDETSVMEPVDLFDTDIGAQGVTFVEGTEETDNSTGTQEIFAGYLMTDFPLGAGFSVNGGLRIESSVQKVSSFALFSEGDDPVENEIDRLDYLPAGGLAYEFWKDMLVRVGYGRTLNRPDFREMSPVCFYSYAGGGDTCGAPELVDNPEWTEDSPEDVPTEVPYDLDRAVIHNFDARWEWYPSEGESISFGGFYKKFDKPIEMIVFSAGGSKSRYFMNSDSAENYGLELDFLKNFGFIADPLEDLYVAGNARGTRSPPACARAAASA